MKYHILNLICTKTNQYFKDSYSQVGEILSVWHVERVVQFYIHWFKILILLTLSVGYSQSKSMPLKPYCFANLTILSASFALEFALFTTCKYKLWNVLWARSDGMLSPSSLRYNQCTYVQSLDMRQDSGNGITTGHGLVGPGIKSQWGWDFPHPSRWDLGPTQPPATGAWSWPPNPI